MDNMGSWVSSSTIDDVPRTIVSFLRRELMPGMVTDFDNNGQMPRAFHDGGLLLCVVVNDELGRQSDMLKKVEKWKSRVWRYFVDRSLVWSHFNEGTELLPSD
jgi:hypothetical protein